MNTPQQHKGRRGVRSYAVRGRITNHQRKALKSLSPDFVIPFTGEALNLVEYFPRPDAPFTVEIGFGMGRSLLELAQQNPKENFLGIEVYPAGVARLMMDAAAAKLDNLKIIQHDAAEVFAKGLPSETLHKVLILFPDPWPKKRHHKRRLVQAGFMSLVVSRLRLGGRIHLATDWREYAVAMMEVMEGLGGVKNLSGAGRYWSDPERPATKFERRGQTLGHEIYDLLYEKL